MDHEVGESSRYVEVHFCLELDNIVAEFGISKGLSDGLFYQSWVVGAFHVDGAKHEECEPGVLNDGLADVSLG